MKVEGKKYCFYAGERPKVLLLGNGINRAFDGDSWDKMLDKLKDRERFPMESKKYLMPMPLKAAMLTQNSLATKMRGIISKNSSDDSSYSWANFATANKDLRDFLSSLFSLGFDYILTTNYSYENEAALLGKESVTENEIRKLQNHTINPKAQTKFLLNTFNTCISGGKEFQIWHIHGEARKPDSIIIGHYYYDRLLSRCIQYLDTTNREFKTSLSEHKPHQVNSWVEAFDWGDVYIIGLGLGFSETDLWWLLESKRIHKQGNVFYYTPIPKSSDVCIADGKIECSKTKDFVTEEQCKLELMKVTNVSIRDLDFMVGRDGEHKDFYKKVYEDLRKTMASSVSE